MDFLFILVAERCHRMYTKVLQEDRYRKDFGGFCGDTFTAVVVPLFVQYLFKCYSTSAKYLLSL